jgi:hypothetical protein
MELLVWGAGFKTRKLGTVALKRKYPKGTGMVDGAN